MRNYLRRFPLLRRLASKWRGASVARAAADAVAGTQEIQALLKVTHRALVAGGARPSFADVGFRRYSQLEEDGILLYVFSLIGEQTRRVVEICCGNGRQCMSANLIVNHGWQGLLFDGDAELLKEARAFFAGQADCVINQPILRRAWITAENVNALIRDAGFAGEIDLLSLDIDGNDYWVWKAIDAVSPRVCVFETHNVIPSNLALTIPYDPSFTIDERYRDFRSASALAMTKLSKEKGYRLIGAHRSGFNAFFMRDDVGTAWFPEVTVESIHDNAFTRASQRERWPAVARLGWREV